MTMRAHLRVSQRRYSEKRLADFISPLCEFRENAEAVGQEEGRGEEKR
jgi:hypothetical protein